MAKLDTIRIVLDGAEKQELDFRFDVNVNKDGQFTTTLPESITERFLDAGLTLGRNRMGRHGYFTATTLEALKQAVSDKAKEYLSKELIAERVVLRYAIDTWAAYCMDANLEPVPNGYFVKPHSLYEKEYKTHGWQEGTQHVNATNAHAYGIMVYVYPFVRRDYRYRTGTFKTFYDRLKETEIEAGGETLRWLEGLGTISETGVGRIQEIDYDENVGAFFVGLVKSIFMLNHRIKDFLTPEAIKMLADNGARLLGGNNLKPSGWDTVDPAVVEWYNQLPDETRATMELDYLMDTGDDSNLFAEGFPPKFAKWLLGGASIKRDFEAFLKGKGGSGGK